MYIKTVSLSNFKSYRQVTTLENINLGLNVFLGPNGAGKSNLFQAIEFALKGNKGSVYGNKKLHILSDGVDGIVSVEVVLKDCDPILGSEVILKRQLHAKGNDYYINNKKTTRLIFSVILEILGFGKQFEFYFVKPNLYKIFFDVSPEERYKNIVCNLGISVSECFFSLKKKLIDRQDMHEKLLSFHDYIKELEVFYVKTNKKEIQNWKKFQELKRRKEHLLIQFELNQLLKWKNKKSDTDITTKTEYVKNCESFMKITANLEDIKQSSALNISLLEDSEKEKNSLTEKFENLQLKISDLNKEISNKQLGTEKYENVLQNLTIKLSKEQANISEENKILDNYKNKLKSSEEERNLIIDKIGRKNAFSDQQSRDEYLNKKINDLVQKIQAEKTILFDINKTKIKQETTLSQYLNNLKKQEEIFLTEKLSKVQERQYSLELSNLHIKLNDVNRAGSILESILIHLNKLISYKLSDFTIKVGKSACDGAESVQKVINMWEHNGSDYVNGYLGKVVDNFNCNEALDTAIDAACGKLIFSHIVATDFIGTEILKEIKNQNLPGEVLFMPMNRINFRNAVQVDDPDAKPLINCIKFSSQFENIMQFIFGSIVICRSIETAIKLAKSHKCVCVTIDGDVVRSTGMLTGGYRERKTSSRTIYNEILKLKEKLDEKTQMIEKNKQDSNELSHKISITLSNLQKLKANKTQDSQKEIINIKNNIEFIKEDIHRKDLSIKTKKQEINRLTNHIFTLQSELEQNFDADQTQDVQRLEYLNKRIIKLNDTINTQYSLVLQKESYTDQIENKIKIIKMHDVQSVDESIEMNTLQKKMRDFILKKELIETRIKLLSDRIREAKLKINENTISQDKYTSQKAELEQKIDEYRFSSITLKKYNLNKIKDLNDKIAECEKTISLNMKKYKHWDFNPMSFRDTNLELFNIKENIKKLGNVKDVNFLNKKASRFSKVKDLLKLCLEISNLYYEKLLKMHGFFNNHIPLTIARLSEIFNLYFTRIVPNSTATLVLENAQLLIKMRSSGEEEITFQPNILSGSQKTALLISIVLALAEIQGFRILTMDEIDQFFSDENIEIVTQIISNNKSLQVFAASHRIKFIEKGNDLYFIENVGSRSKLSKVENPDDPNVLHNLLKLTGRVDCTPDESMSTSF